VLRFVGDLHDEGVGDAPRRAQRHTDADAGDDAVDLWWDGVVEEVIELGKGRIDDDTRDRGGHTAP
jgi:hypothetical protein